MAKSEEDKLFDGVLTDSELTDIERQAEKEEEEIMRKTRRIKRIVLKITLFLAVIVFLWFSLTVYEYYRVKMDKRPFICIGDVRDTETENEYSSTCYGVLYKYREYRYKDDDSLSAREFTLVFKEFDREA